MFGFLYNDKILSKDIFISDLVSTSGLERFRLIPPLQMNEERVTTEKDLVNSLPIYKHICVASGVKNASRLPVGKSHFLTW